MGATSTKSKDLRDQERRRLSVQSFDELQGCIERANANQICKELGMEFSTTCHVEQACFLWKAFTDVEMVQNGATAPRGRTGHGAPKRIRIGQKAFLNILLKLELTGEHPAAADGEKALQEAVTKASAAAADVSYDEHECTICLDLPPDPSLECGHSFCHRCLEDWSNANAAMAGCCPVCRVTVSAEEAWELTEAPEESERVDDIQSTLAHFSAAARARPDLDL